MQDVMDNESLNQLDVSQLTYLESGMVKLIVLVKEGQNNLDGLVWLAVSGLGLLHQPIIKALELKFTCRQ